MAALVLKRNYTDLFQTELSPPSTLLAGAGVPKRTAIPPVFYGTGLYYYYRIG
jgi:hypothetical protein